MIKRDTLAFQMLVAMARQRAEFDAGSCRARLEMVASSEEIRARIRRGLRTCGLSDAQAAVLIVMLAFDPEPALPSALAEHAGVTRASITDAVNRLHAIGYATREDSRIDRRNRLVTLTGPGRRMADRAAVEILRALSGPGRPPGPPAPAPKRRKRAALRSFSPCTQTAG